MGKLIDADAAIDAVVGCTNCGNEDELRAYVTKHSLENGWTGGIVDALDAIEQLPSVQPDTTTHNSIPVETGKNDSDRTSGDCISRQQAIDALKEKVFHNLSDEFYGAMQVLDELPSALPERKTGHWILDRSGAYCCSKCMEPCASYAMMKPRDKFCKMCGSRNEVTE